MPELSIRAVTTDADFPAAGLAGLLVDSVHGGASVGFLAPLSEATALEYWEQIRASLETVRLWVAEIDGRVVGSVQLALCTKPNGVHRAELQKLLVHSGHRGRGIAGRLMTACEDYARFARRTLLYLDTEAGSEAESIYRHLGWEKAGEIPFYFARPTGELHTTAVYYKRVAP
jgi:acetyltransferase